MAGGNINADVKTGAGGEIAYLAYRFGDDIPGEGNNQVMFFGQRDKHVRGDPPLARVIPAQQNFDPDARLSSGIHQRLTEKLKFPFRNTHIDFPGEAHAVRCGQPGEIAQQQAQHQSQRQLCRQAL